MCLFFLHASHGLCAKCCSEPCSSSHFGFLHVREKQWHQNCLVVHDCNTSVMDLHGHMDSKDVTLSCGQLNSA